jgi:hypothetical protein
MSLQTIIDTAVNIEINRSQLVAQSLSRSGRLLTVSRNWANPFRFSVTPKPIWRWDEYRDEIQTVMDADRYTEQSFYLSNSTGSAWMTAYRGQLDATNNKILDFYTVSTFSGTSLVLTTVGSPTIGQYVVRTGDWVRPTDHRYPYMVTADVVVPNPVSPVTIPVHRGAIPQGGYTVAGKTVQLADSAARFYVQMTKLPTVKFIFKEYVEFTGNFEFIEVVL